MKLIVTHILYLIFIKSLLNITLTFKLFKVLIFWISLLIGVDLFKLLVVGFTIENSSKNTLKADLKIKIIKRKYCII